MSRSTQLGVELRLAIDQAKAQYNEFKAWVESNPPHASIAQTTASASGGARVSHSFSGQAVVTNAPANPPFPIAPQPIPVGAAPVVVTTRPPAVSAPVTSLPGVAAVQATAYNPSAANVWSTPVGPGGADAALAAMRQSFANERARIQNLREQVAEVQQMRANQDRSFPAPAPGVRWSPAPPVPVDPRAFSTVAPPLRWTAPRPEQPEFAAPPPALRWAPPRPPMPSRSDFAAPPPPLRWSAPRLPAEEDEFATLGQYSPQGMERRRAGLGPFGRFATGYFIATQAARVGGDLLGELAQQQLMGNDPLLLAQSHLRGIQSFESIPLLGQLSQMIRYGVQRGRGQPTAEADVVNIERFRADREAATWSANIRTGADVEESEAKREGRRALIRDPYQKLREESRDRVTQYEEQQNATRDALYQQWAELHDTGRTIEANRQADKLKAFDEQREPRLRAQINKELQVREGQRLEYESDTRGMRRRTESVRLTFQGNYPAAAYADIEAEFDPVRNESGEVVGFGGYIAGKSQEQQLRFRALKDQYLVQKSLVPVRESARLARLRGETQSRRSALNYDPLQSQLDTIAGEKEALRTSGIEGDEFKRQMTLLDLSEQQVRQQFRDQASDIGTSLIGRLNSVQAMRAMHPISAEVYSSGAEGAVGVAQLRRQFGKTNPELAQTAAQVAIEQLSLVREQYLREFRGTEVDYTNLGAGNVRQGEDLADITRAIGQSTRDIITALGELASD